MNVEPARSPRVPYHAFPDPHVDTLFKTVLALGAEVWVLKDRVAMLEEVLADRGIDVTTDIEARASGPERPGMREERDAYFGRFLQALSTEA